MALSFSTPTPAPTPTPLPLRPNPSSNPNLPEDPVIPHNGFQTLEEGEKAFTHLLRKAGVDANWTWDQTMRAIITDPLYRALNSLAEKKGCWEKVFFFKIKKKRNNTNTWMIVHNLTETKRNRRKRSQAC